MLPVGTKRHPPSSAPGARAEGLTDVTQPNSTGGRGSPAGRRESRGRLIGDGLSWTARWSLRLVRSVRHDELHGEAPAVLANDGGRQAMPRRMRHDGAAVLGVAPRRVRIAPPEIRLVPDEMMPRQLPRA